MTRKDIAKAATRIINSNRSSDKRKPLLTEADAADLINVVTLVIAESVEAGETVILRGFGSFAPKQRGPKTARNISTGEPITVPPRTKPVFTPAKEFCQRVTIEAQQREKLRAVTNKGFAVERN